MDLCHFLQFPSKQHDAGWCRWVLSDSQSGASSRLWIDDVNGHVGVPEGDVPMQYWTGKRWKRVIAKFTLSTARQNEYDSGMTVPFPSSNDE